MQNDFNVTGVKDPNLWYLARKRASFKYHLTSYVLVNSSLWSLWALTTDETYKHYGFPWPVFPMLGWGIGLFFHFMAAYIFPGNNLAEHEYQKLVNQKNINSSIK